MMNRMSLKMIKRVDLISYWILAICLVFGLCVGVMAGGLRDCLCHYRNFCPSNCATNYLTGSVRSQDWRYQCFDQSTNLLGEGVVGQCQSICSNAWYQWVYDSRGTTTRLYSVYCDTNSCTCDLLPAPCPTRLRCLGHYRLDYDWSYNSICGSGTVDGHWTAILDSCHFYPSIYGSLCCSQWYEQGVGSPGDYVAPFCTYWQISMTERSSESNYFGGASCSVTNTGCPVDGIYPDCSSVYIVSRNCGGSVFSNKTITVHFSNITLTKP